MKRHVAQRGVRPVSRSRPGQTAKLHRPIFECLEDRTMLSDVTSQLPAAIVLGRTLATPSTAGTPTPSPSYFVGEVQNNQVTITFTVYNQQGDPETGVLVTDTLAPGVTMASASQQPDQSGRNLAWSLGTIPGDARASVSVTVNLPNQTSLKLDTGANTFAMLDGDAVSATTPAATLQPGNVSDPSLLASTVDADTNDPYIQEQAAALAYDPDRIFNFLHTEIGYNSYLGSVRGARGTLWSSAGNSLDVASLGVALMRASGVPAQYVSGTLSKSDSQELILSMFPAQYQTVGYIPSGTETSDPANDPQLLAETESHYWFQFRSGGVMTDADPLMAGATVGQTFTSSTGAFSAVPADLEETTEVQLIAEIYSQASAAFGLSSGLQDTTVLDQTFDDAQLVGRPLSIGNYVSQSGAGAIFTEVTNTYTPYIAVGDEANPNPSQDEIIQGTPYQEILTNFPLGTQVLTGLFLNITLSGPSGAAESYQRALLDRIGPAIRQNGGTPNVSIDPSGPPAFTNQDIFTLYAMAGLNDPSFPGQFPAAFDQLDQESAQLQATASSSAAGEGAILTSDLIAVTDAVGAGVLTDSDATTSRLASDSLVTAYWVRPRLVLVSNMVVIDTSSQTARSAISVDLRRDTMRVLSFPGQSASTAIAFDALRGVAEGQVEQQVPTILVPPSQPASQSVSAAAVFQAALAQGIGLVLLTTENLSSLDSMNISPDAKTLITAAIEQGNSVIVPAQSVPLNGTSTTAWYQVDPTTGETIAVTQDGGHQTVAEYGAILALIGLFVYGTVSFVKWLGPIVTNWFKSIQAHFTIHSLPPILADIQGPLSSETTAQVAGLPELGDEFTSLLQQAINLPLPGAPNVTSLSSPLPKQPLGFNDPDADVSNPATLSAGTISANIQSTAVAASGQLVASWSGNTIASFLVNSLSAGAATVTGQNGQAEGAGLVHLTASKLTVAVSGDTSYVVTGQGSLSAYASSTIGPAIGGDWQNYSAALSGQVALTLTTSSLTLNGTTLPAGTYTITSSSAALTGSGATASPDFAQSVSIAATNGTVYLGAGTGNVSVAGSPLSAANGMTLDGYTGTLALTFGGSSLSAALSGSAANLLAVAGAPAALTTDQNHSITFQSNVLTNQAETFHTDVIAPSGWIASISQTGLVTLAPPPGVQSGTYPIELKALLLSDPDFVARTFVNVAITPTQTGISFSVAPDTKLAVPFNGANLPTTLTATIQNLGPAADTYNLTFSDVPSGFSIADSGTSVTVPAGETGIVGIYLLPDPGQSLPSPGTQLSFTVTATSATDSSITQTKTETFTIPAIDAVALTSNPTTVNAIPGAATTDTLTITNAGNVDENSITLAGTTSSGLTLTGLAPVSLAVGQSTTETITLTPSATTPLNSTLEATITATYGPSGSPLTQTLDLPVNVVVPGAAAIASAAGAAGQLGNANLADRLDDLSTALTNLVQNPTSAVYGSQAQASLSAVAGLLSSDPFLASVASTLKSDGSALAQATTASAVQTAVSKLGNDLGSVATILSDEAAHNFTLSFITNSQIGQPQVGTTYQLVLQNTGSQTTTYDLGISGLPSGVTGSLSQSTITLSPGQVTPGSSGVTDLLVTITSTSATELSPFNFTVTATALGASELTQAIVGSFTVRQALVQVTSVATNPTFTNPGGLVDVSARILNAVNKQQQAEVYYTVTDASNNVIFTSQPVTTTLNVLTTLSTVDLGNLDTTGLALGQDTIKVIVDDSSGNPIPGAIGTGTLLIGTPVTATLSTAPDTLPAGNGTVTTTLQVAQNPAAATTPSLVGQVATSAGDSSVALLGSYAYVGGLGAITIVDVSNPASPTVVKTFGSGDFRANEDAFVRISGNELIVDAAQPATPPESLLVYSLADPLNPTLLGQTTITQTGSGFTTSPPLVVNNHAYLSVYFFRYLLSGHQILQQHGELISIDISNPAAPIVDGVVYNLPPDATSGYPDGDSFVYQVAAVNNQTLLAGSTTSTGTTLPGTGVVMVVDTTNASSPSLVRTVPIPGTAVIFNIAMESGNRALVVGSTGNLDSSAPGPYPLFSGNLVLTTLDLTNPQNPTIIATQTLSQSSQFLDPDDLVSLGNDMFALGNGQLRVDNNPELLLIDASQPGDATVTTLSVPNLLTDYAASGNLLYTVSTSGLLIYNLGAASNMPVTAKVTVPANDGVSIVPSSFNVTPASITTNPDGSETLEWDLGLSSSGSQTFTWQENVTGLQAGESLPVAQDASVEFTSQGTTGTLTLPEQFVAGDQIIGLSPATDTVAPGAPASYDVTLLNPTSSPATYDLTVEGVAAGWVNLESSVTVAANGSVDVPLVLTSDSFSALSDYGFSVSASGTNGATASVQGDLVLQGQPVPPDPNSHGIVAALTEAQATAGQGTSAHYVVQLTNTGSTDDTFTLSATGLPSGARATFGQTSIDVPPGASNFRDVTLTLTPARKTTPGSYPFTVTAASTTDAAVTGSTSGTLTVVAGGVQVTLNPGSGAPGTSFQETVTNTGTITDTYKLALAGPAALVSSLGTSSVTLAPGASQNVPITTGAVGFAVQGSLPLTAVATSTTNPAFQGAASSDLTIAASQGMTAEFSPASQTLSIPGMATFLLMVHNTGNTEDSYSATIMGENGPVTATLVGLDGSPTQSIPTFILPGLSTGAIELQADIASMGQGTVTVAIQSLTRATINASPMATVAVGPSVSRPAPPPVVTDGPIVKEVQRFGYHMMPTSLVLTFDQALDQTTADDTRNYRIIGPRGRTIRVKRAVYDPTTLTVTLDPFRRINVHYRYTLIVDGAKAGSVTDAQGLLLDGTADGKPGSNYRAPITWRDLVLDPPLAKTARRSRTTTPTAEHRPKSEPAHTVPNLRLRRGTSRRSPALVARSWPMTTSASALGRPGAIDFLTRMSGDLTRLFKPADI